MVKPWYFRFGTNSQNIIRMYKTKSSVQRVLCKEKLGEPWFGVLRVQ